MHRKPSSPPLAGGYVTRNTIAAVEQLAVRPRSAPELAEAVGVDVRTARRLLHRLAAEGYVVQGAGHRRRYALTLRLAAVAATSLATAPILRCAGPGLARISAATGCRAQLWAAGPAGACRVAEAGPEGPVELLLRPDVAPGEQELLLSVLDQGRSLRASLYVRNADVAKCASTVLAAGRATAVVLLCGTDVRVAHLAEVRRLAGAIDERSEAAL